MRGGVVQGSGRRPDAIYETAPLLKIARIRATVEGMGVSEYLATRLSPSQTRAFWRGRVGWRLADELACALGHHPTNIWPTFDRDLPDHECFHSPKVAKGMCHPCYLRHRRWQRKAAA